MQRKFKYYTLLGHDDDFVDGLYISNTYTLERLDGLEWVAVKPLPEFEEEVNPFWQKIHKDRMCTISFKIPEKYGTLPAGKYRVSTYIHHLKTYNENKPLSKVYQIEFKVRK